MILGNYCTRNCRFCKVEAGFPEPVDAEEPKKIARAVKKLGLEYVVITSVTRDDLPDGGAGHFASVVREVKQLNFGVKIEVLIPDFRGEAAPLRAVLDSGVDVLSHNLETVPRLYSEVRPQADYHRSLELLRRAKAIKNGVYTKSGIMVGLGETAEEVEKVIDDLRFVECDLLTIGQYLAPSRKHLPVQEYIEPGRFEEYRGHALERGFLAVAAGPFVRSSYQAPNLLGSLKG